MNYYQHHIGDFAKDAGFLSMLEEGAYRRLLDAYYSRERALPADLKECCKLARASTKPEREAVAYVLEHFFAPGTPGNEGRYQKRCDEEILRFQDKQAKARRSANERWQTNQSSSDGNANASPDAMRTHSEGNATRARPQSPITNNQSKAITPSPERSPSSPAPTEGGRACLLMRQAGCAQTNPSNPSLAAALAEGITPETLADYARIAVDRGIRMPFAYAITAARNDRSQGVQPATGDSRNAEPRESHAARITRKYLAEQAAAERADLAIGHDDADPVAPDGGVLRPEVVEHQR